MDENPIDASIDYLIESGWTKDEAKKLLGALFSNDAQDLWEFAPDWIELVGEAKRQMALFEVVARGLANVTRRDGEWVYAISEAGRKVGKQLFGEQNGSK